MSKTKKIIVFVLVISVLSVIFIIPASAADLDNLGAFTGAVTYYGYTSGNADSVTMQPVELGKSVSAPFTSGKDFRIRIQRTQERDPNNKPFYKTVYASSGYIFFDFQFYIKSGMSSNIGNLSKVDVGIIRFDSSDDGNDDFFSGYLDSTAYSIEWRKFFTLDKWVYKGTVKINCSQLPLNSFDILRIDLNFDKVSVNDYKQIIWDEFSWSYVSNYENQNSLEEEKQQANTQGNASVDDLNNAMPNQTAGFDNALGSFANAMGNTATTASWQMPAIYLPAIPGVMDRVQLTSAQTIDFGKAINDLIPKDILLLVQYLGTAALILYCGKELWHWISYAMSLRKGDN